MAKPGRKTKLTPETEKKIVQALRLGNYIDTAAAYAGISKQTLYNWLKRGARAGSSKSIYKRFSDAVDQAMAEAEMRDLATIGNASKEQWQAAAWRLERRFPERWRKRESVDAKVDHAGKVEHEDTTLKDVLENASEVERAEIIRIVRRASFGSPGANEQIRPSNVGAKLPADRR